MLNLNNTNIDTYIIDEDIVLSCLIPTMLLKLSQLEDLITEAEKVKAQRTKGQLITIKEKIIEAMEKSGQAFKMPAFQINDKEIQSIIEAKQNNLDVNVKEVLRNRIITAN